MLFSPFLATRYLKPKRTFVSIITVISILGVVLGVWLLTVVIAIFAGYGERIKDSILGFEPHLTIDAGGYIDDFAPVIEELGKIDGLVEITPMVSGQVVMDFQGMRSAPVIRGIPPPKGEELKRLQSKIARAPDPNAPDDPDRAIRRGEFDLSDYYSAVIGDGIADAQNIRVGDKLTLYSPRDMNSVLETIERAQKAESPEERDSILNEVKEMTLPQEVTVTGIFNSGHWDFDSTFIYLHLETAQVLYNFDLEECHKVTVRTDEAFAAHLYKEKIDAILPDHFRTLTWGEMYRSIFDAVAAEKQAMYVILFMIVIVGGFCIMNTMITVTYQKRSEIGLLKALGAREGQIVWVFLFQGLLVGLIGVLVGLGLAELTVYFRNDIGGWVGRTFGVSIFEEDIYKVDGGLPAHQNPKDLLIISIGSFVACTLASLIPAMMAASLQPAKALRSE